MTTKYMTNAERREAILLAAIHAATKSGYSNFRLVDVAAVAECSTALVMLHYKTMTQVRRAVMRRAIQNELLPLIATGIAIKDPNCRKLDPELRARALATLSA